MPKESIWWDSGPFLNIRQEYNIFSNFLLAMGDHNLFFFSFDIYLLVEMMIWGGIGKGNVEGKWDTLNRSEEFYVTWPNKICDSTQMVIVSYIFIFLSCMNWTLWLIPQYFTCCNIKGWVTEKLHIESTRIKFLS